jgi:hypothetical protein
MYVKMMEVFCIQDYGDSLNKGRWYQYEWLSINLKSELIVCTNRKDWYVSFTKDLFRKHFITLEEYRERQLEELGI